MWFQNSNADCWDNNLATRHIKLLLLRNVWKDWMAQWVSTCPQYTIDPLFSFSISISAHENFGKFYNKMHKSPSFYFGEFCYFVCKGKQINTYGG